KAEVSYFVGQECAILKSSFLHVAQWLTSLPAKSAKTFRYKACHPFRSNSAVVFGSCSAVGASQKEADTAGKAITQPGIGADRSSERVISGEKSLKLQQ